MKCHVLSGHRLSQSGIVGIVCVMFSLGIGMLLPLQSAAAHGADASTAYVRVIHASPYVGTADVFVDGQALLSAFQFAAVTAYVPVPPGVHKVQIALLGKGINASLITEDLPIAAGGVYTVAAVGATPTTLGLQVFQDNNQVVANQAKVRIYHLSPDAGTVNVDVGGDVQLNNLGYPNASNYVTTDPGPCTLTISDPTYSSSLPLSMNLDANMVTSIFTVGLFAGSPKIQLVSSQTQGIPGLPQTGSNPVVADLVSPLAPWALLAVALAFIGLGTLYRIKRVRVA